MARWLPERADAPRQDVAERLGQWLNVKEAIGLHTARAVRAPVGAPTAPHDLSAPETTALHERLQAELQRVRAVLTQSIRARDATHIPDPNDLDTEFALFHQHLIDQQRRMELSVDALRAHVREQFARSTPAHAQLAALDAQMERLFGGREQRLLGQLPLWVRARYQALRREAAASPADAGAPPGLHWLADFAAELEQLLFAELDLRLQPVIGLIESVEP